MKINTIPLEEETRTVLPTAEAAYHLNRKPQTLQIWACRDTGPIRPIHVGRLLGWKTDDIRKLLDEEACNDNS